VVEVVEVLVDVVLVVELVAEIQRKE